MFFFVKYIKMKYIKKTRQKIKEFRMSSYFSPRWSDCPSTAACSARIAPASHSALFLGSQHACSARRSCRGSSRKSTCRPFLALFRNSDLSKICFFFRQIWNLPLIIFVCSSSSCTFVFNGSALLSKFSFSANSVALKNSRQVRKASKLKLLHLLLLA